MDEEFEIIGYEPPLDEEFEVVGFEPVEPSPVAEQSTPAYYNDSWGKQFQRIGQGAAMLPLEAMSAINRGVGGLVQGAGELTGIDAITGAGDWLKENSRLTSQGIRNTAGINPGAWEDTALSIGGEVGASLATMGGGVLAGAGKLATAAAPLVYQSGQRYSDLRDRGAEPGEAALATAASAPVTAGLNLIDVGAITKAPGASNLLTEYLKRSGTIAGVNAATNAAGTYADAVIDSNIADTPLTREEFISRLGTSALTGAATGPAFAAMGLRRQSPDAADYLAKMTPEIDGPRQIADVEAPVPMAETIDAPQQIPDIEAPVPQAESVSPVAPEPVIAPEGSQIIEPPPATPRPYKPIADIEAPQRQELPPVEKSIVDHVVNSDGYKAAKKLAEESAGIRDQVKAAEAAEPKPVVPAKVEVDSSKTFGESPIAKLEQQPQPKQQEVEIPQQQEGLFSVPDRDATVVSGLATTEVPLNQLTLSQDVPQWKRGADDSGVTERLQGKFDRTGVAPIAVWERADGRLEVISGRHRFDLARRSGEQTIPAQIFRESEGFTAQDAKVLDVELNIRDEKGDVRDYAIFFRETGIDQATATERGLLSRDKGLLGFEIGKNASPDVFALFQDERINPAQAAAIARAAPGNADAQTVGARMALKRASANEISMTLRTLADQASQVPASQQTSMFGDDRAVRLAEAQSQVALEKSNEIGRQIKAVKNAANDPARAQQMGLPVQDPVAIMRKVQQLEFERARLDEFYKHPDLKEQIAAEALSRFENGPGRQKALQWSNESGRVINPMILIEDAGNFIRNLFVRPADDGSQGFTGPKKVYKDYQDGKGAFWRRNLEWMTTTAERVPQAKPAIQAGWEFGHDNSALMYEHNQMLKPFMELPEKSRVNAVLYATRVATSQAAERGQKLVADTNFFINKGLTPQEADAAVSILKWSRWTNELNRREALESATYKAQKEGRSVSPEESQRINEYFDQLAEANYVPFSRFGKYYAEMEASDGTRHWQQFEKEDEMKRFVAQAKKAGWAEMEAGEMRLNNFSKHDGVSMDILAALDDADSPIPVQGWKGHLLKARLVPGHSIDLERSLADYAVGQSRTLALRRMERNMEKGLDQMKLDQDLKPVYDKVVAWKEALVKRGNPYLKGITDAMNVAYIGGNARTSIADVLGRVQMQYPILARYTSGLGAEKVFTKAAFKEAQWYAGRLNDKNLLSGIEAATKKGIIPPLERRGVTAVNPNSKLMRKARGKDGMLATVHDFHFTLKALSERSTDLGGFIAGWEAYPQAVKKMKGDIPSRQQFAENFVRETRAVPSKDELTAVFQSDALRLPLKFRTYQGKILVSYFKALKDKELGVIGRQLLSAGLTTGIKGIPFMSTLFVAMRGAGYEPETEIRKVAPKKVADYGMYGIFSEATGLDLSNAASFGEVLPGIGTDMNSALVKTFLGMGGAPFESIAKTIRHAERGQNLKALASLPFMPQPISNLAHVIDRSQRGVQTIGGDGVIPPEELSTFDQIAKLLGVTTTKVSKEYAKNNVIQQGKRRDTEFFNQRIADSRFVGNREREMELRREAAQKGIKVDNGTINDKVRAMSGDIRAKIKGAPKGNKRQIRQDLELYED